MIFPPSFHSSVPGHPRDDVHRVRIPHDLPQEVRLQQRGTQLPRRCFRPPVGHPGQRMDQAFRLRASLYPRYHGYVSQIRSIRLINPLVPESFCNQFFWFFAFPVLGTLDTNGLNCFLNRVNCWIVYLSRVSFVSLSIVSLCFSVYLFVCVSVCNVSVTYCLSVCVCVCVSVINLCVSGCQKRVVSLCDSQNMRACAKFAIFFLFSSNISIFICIFVNLQNFN